jgi:hypothetical protein
MFYYRVFYEEKKVVQKKQRRQSTSVNVESSAPLTMEKVIAALKKLKGSIFVESRVRLIPLDTKPTGRVFAV